MSTPHPLFRLLTALILATLLSGCGFALRGSQPVATTGAA